MTHVDVPRLARALPKAELHCHLEGAVRRATFVELAARNGVTLPPGDPDRLFEFSDLAGFLEIFGLVCSTITTVDDYRRITYEALEDAAAANIRYREMFFSPGFGAPYGVTPQTMWAGIEAGLADAHADLDIRCRMILDVDKAAPPASAVELVEFAAQQDRDLLVGIGGDNTERGIDHRSFAEAFELAGRQGLRRTFHAGEDGPAENIRIAIEVLGCERIDHGVRLLDDPELTARVVDEGIPLTVCPISNVVLSATVPDVASHPFDRQRAAGVRVTINSDDPTYSDTTIDDDYEAVAAAFGYDLATMQDLALAAVDAAWAPEDERRSLRARFEAEMAGV
jgi:adenosine deaminase